MNALRAGFRDTIGTLGELLHFLWRGKVWWLTPVVVILLLTAIVVLFAETSVIAPFIYTLF